jgi:hypothetical protein
MDGKSVLSRHPRTVPLDACMARDVLRSRAWRPAAFYAVIVMSLGFLIGAIAEAIRFSVVTTEVVRLPRRENPIEGSRC